MVDVSIFCVSLSFSGVLLDFYELLAQSSGFRLVQVTLWEEDFEMTGGLCYKRCQEMIKWSNRASGQRVLVW